MADECIPCGTTKRPSGPPQPRKRWRVITGEGRRLDFLTEQDADAAVRRFGGSKRKLSG